MTIVPSVKLEDLPVVVKFILQNVKAADAVEVQYLSNNEMCVFHTSVGSNRGKLFHTVVVSELYVFNVFKLNFTIARDQSQPC